MVDEEGVLLQVSALQEEIPLLHHLVGPHVEGGGVELEPEGLTRSIATLHISTSVSRMSSAE